MRLKPGMLKKVLPWQKTAKSFNQPNKKSSINNGGFVLKLI